MRPERLAYLRKMQYLYINGISLFILAGMFFLINSVSVGISLIVMGVFVLALIFYTFSRKGSANNRRTKNVSGGDGLYYTEKNR